MEVRINNQMEVLTLICSPRCHNLSRGRGAVSYVSYPDQTGRAPALAELSDYISQGAPHKFWRGVCREDS